MTGLSTRRQNAEALRALAGDTRTPRTGRRYYMVSKSTHRLIEVTVTAVSTNGATAYATWTDAADAPLCVSGRFMRRWCFDRYFWLLEGHGRGDHRYSLMSRQGAMNLAETYRGREKQAAR